ncbi:MAG: LysM peptidoglycan-binding domain-containing protein [Acidobacteria bacterium]|nr:LysM peptidoglycan-binding domain-containing protein [Acidobacteriota bacterium]
MGIKKDFSASGKSATSEKKTAFTAQTKPAASAFQGKRQPPQPAAKPFHPPQVPSRPEQFAPTAGRVNITTPTRTPEERSFQPDSGAGKSQDHTIAWGAGLLGLLLFALLAWFINSGEGPVDTATVRASSVKPDRSRQGETGQEGTETADIFSSVISGATSDIPPETSAPTPTSAAPVEPELPYQSDGADEADETPPAAYETSEAELAALETSTVTPEPPSIEPTPTPVETDPPYQPENVPSPPADLPPAHPSKVVEVRVPSRPGREAGVIVHHIVWGDTLSKISRRYLDDMMLFPRLAQQNKIKNPDLIYAGNILYIRIEDEDELTREE